LVPKSLTSNNKAAGLFDKADFRYIPAKDEYRCPAGQRAIWRFTTVEHGLTLHKYWSSACPRCLIKAQCTTGEYRRIARWEHEKVIDAMQKRLDRAPQASRIRRRTVEHPLRHAQSMDGGDAFPDQDIATREYRNEFACTSLQPETSDANPRNRAAYGSDQGLSARFFLLHTINSVLFPHWHRRRRSR